MTTELCDADFLAAFEGGTLPPAGFHHREHVRAAWLCLQAGPPLDALQRFSSALQRFAAALGEPERYHETITWAYLFLIRERMAARPSADFAAFSADNPELVAWDPARPLLERYYRPETLRSELARRVYVMPDAALPG